MVTTQIIHREMERLTGHALRQEVDSQEADDKLSFTWRRANQQAEAVVPKSALELSLNDFSRSYCLPAAARLGSL